MEKETAKVVDYSLSEADGYAYLTLANEVIAHFETMLIKTKIKPDDYWVLIERLCEATLSQAKSDGFDGNLIDWIDTINMVAKIR